MDSGQKGKKYRLYLAGGIQLWKDRFRDKYSPFFNKKAELFEPGTINTPADHRKIPDSIAGFDLWQINLADAVIAYLKNYATSDGSPCGTDSTWEIGYAIGLCKPVIAIIEDDEQIDYYARQWMVSFNISAVIAVGKKIAEAVKSNPKFCCAKIFEVQNAMEMESAIIRYLNEFSRSVHAKMGEVNYKVDARARGLFSRETLAKILSANMHPSFEVAGLLERLGDLEFEGAGDFLEVCIVEREISEYYRGKMDDAEIDAGISAVLEAWGRPLDYILDCLCHSIFPPFAKVKGRKQGIKKTRPWVFHEIYGLLSSCNIHSGSTFAYDVGAIFEFYNWVNTYAIDDVFDCSMLREKELTVWKKFLKRDAIFTGILGHLLALKYVLKVSGNVAIAGEIALSINEYNLAMYKGQVFDIYLTRTGVTMLFVIGLKESFYENYVRRVYGICGGFYEAIAVAAAKAACFEKENAIGEDCHNSGLFGMHFGIMQMIRNDLGDFVQSEWMPATGKGMKSISHNDIEEGKLTLPYFFAFDSGHLKKSEMEFLAMCLGMRLGESEKMRVNELLWKSGAVHLTTEVIRLLCAHVKSNIVLAYRHNPVRAKSLVEMLGAAENIIIPFRMQALKYGWQSREFDTELSRKVFEKIVSLEAMPQGERLAGFEELFG